MAPSPLDSPVTMERDFFLPGETTLARSDEDTRPLDMEEMKRLLYAPYSNFYKEMTGLRPSDGDGLQQMIDKVYPPTQEVIKKYWKEYKVWVADMDLVEISGWWGAKQGARKWLQLSASNDSKYLKQLAKEIGDILESSGYPEVSCIILLDTYNRRTVDYTTSQPKEEQRPATRESIDPQTSRYTLDLMRHVSLVSGSAIGPCLEKPKDHNETVWEGTVAAYLTNGLHSIAISNSHVVGNQGNKQSDEYLDLSPHAPKNNYQMPADPTYDHVYQKLPQHIANLGYELTAAEDNQNEFEIKETKSALEYATKLRDNILVGFDTPAKRRIGHTLWASGLTSTAGPFLWMSGYYFLTWHLG